MTPAAAPAAVRWRRELEAWALPASLLDAAPESPYAFPPSIIARAPVDPLTTPTGRRVREVLRDGEPLLDVGCGAGRISGAFTDAHPVVGVESREELAAVARERGIVVVPGRWPDVAGEVEPAPVVLCTHVLYDVQDAAPFVAALHRHAGRRVVCELTARHPWVPLRPSYRRFHDLDRPTGPAAELAAEVVADAVGVVPQLQRWSRPGSRYPSLAETVAHRRRQLCLTADRDPEVAEVVAAEVEVLDDGTVQLPPQELVTLWWDVPAGAG